MNTQILENKLRDIHTLLTGAMAPDCMRDRPVDALVEEAEEKLNDLENELAAESAPPALVPFSAKNGAGAAPASPAESGERCDIYLALWKDPETRRHEYPIEYRRVDTAEKALGWIHHLCKKSWATPHHFFLLATVAAEQGAQIDHDA